MKDLGYGKGYAYDHDTDEGFSGQDYFPDGLPRQTFYRPVERGFERDVRKRLEYWEKLRLQAQADKAGGPKGTKGTGSRSEEHTSELQSLMRISYAVFCLKKKNKTT